MASRLSSINPSGNGRKVYEAGASGESRIEYYHTDHLGNVRLAFSDLDGDNAITVRDIYYPANEILQERHYYPFGLTHTGPWFATVAPDNAYRYNGKELDEATGLYDYGARYYDPAVARWEQVDPIGHMVGELNSYAYCMGNPVLYVDPFGLFSTKREARQHRRQERRDASRNGTQNSLEGSTIGQNRDGSFRLEYKNSDGYVTRGSGGGLEYGAVATFEGPAIRSSEGPNYWARLEQGNLAQNIIYGVANGINVFLRQPFQGRGTPILTLNGSTVTKGTDEAIMSGIDGMLVLAPLPLPKGIPTAGRAFHSGSSAAMSAARASGFKTLNQTIGGKLAATGSKVLPDAVMSPIWRALSRRWANNTVGEANIFLAPTGPTPGGFYLTIEKPALIRDGVKLILH